MAVLLVALVIAQGASALAQTPPTQGAASPQDPLVRGDEALDRGDYEAAVVALREALTRSPEAAIFYHLGLAYRAMGKYVEAISAFERYAATSEPDPVPGLREGVRGAIILLRDQLARVTLTVTPLSATLHVDGREVALHDVILMNPGTSVLELSAPGYEPERRELVLRAGEQRGLRIDLRPSSRVEPQGRMIIEPSLANATVMVGGVSVGTGRVDREVPVGEHTVVVRASGYQPFRRVVRVGAMGVTRIDATMVPLSRQRGWLLPLVIAGSAAIVAGAVALGVALYSPPIESVVPGNLGVLTVDRGP